MRVGRREAHSPALPGRKGLAVWTVVYVAGGWMEAERLKDRLAKDGLLVMLRACGSVDDRLAKHAKLSSEIESRNPLDPDGIVGYCEA